MSDFQAEFTPIGDIAFPSHGFTDQGDPIHIPTNDRGDTIIPNHGFTDQGDPIAIPTTESGDTTPTQQYGKAFDTYSGYLIDVDYEWNKEPLECPSPGTDDWFDDLAQEFFEHGLLYMNGDEYKARTPYGAMVWRFKNKTVDELLHAGYIYVDGANGSLGLRSESEAADWRGENSASEDERRDSSIFMVTWDVFQLMYGIKKAPEIEDK